MAPEESNASKRRRLEDNSSQILTPPPGFLPITQPQTEITMNDECLSSNKRRIEETILEILKTSDMETATEISVRSAAAQRLGFELSDLSHRLLVRQLIEAYLLSNADSILETTSLQCNDRNLSSGKDGELHNTSNGKLICKLSERKMVTVREQDGTNVVSIRDFRKQDGRMRPRAGVNAGITLASDEWFSFRDSFPSIQEAISKMESRVRCEDDAKQRVEVVTNPSVEAVSKQNAETIVNPSVEAVTGPSLEAIAKQSVEAAKNSVGDSAAEISKVQPVSSGMKNTIHTPIIKKHNEANASNRVTAPNYSHEEIPGGVKPTGSDIRTLSSEFPNHGKLHNTPDATRPIQLIPIQPARFDGRNYHSWRLHMEIFLGQMNLFYVLTEPCPSISLNPDAIINDKAHVQSAVQRWIKDDYMCKDHILKSLCDSLFHTFSQKIYSAKDLWEELKLIYNENFGTKRSQINKYLNFQMVDGISIIEQVEELHKMANSIIATGFSFIDENFHVSAIISKLPPSWNEFRVTLMHEDFLPVNILTYRLKAEEESRKNYKKESNYRKDQKRKKENRRGCFRCGKEGHAIKYCPDQRVDTDGKNNNGNESGASAKDANMSCFRCGKEGHIIKNCPDQRVNTDGKNNNGNESGASAKDANMSCFRCGKEGHVIKNCPDQRVETDGKNNNGNENGALAKDANMS